MMKMRGMVVAAALVALCALVGAPALAEPETATTGLEEHMINVPLPRGAEIRGLVSKRVGTHPDRVVLLFVGSPGILHLREVDGAPQYEMKGNFLARARRHLNDNTVMTVLVDCPTDQWDSCGPDYRRSAQHAEDIGALMAALTKELGPVKFTIVGTSFGTVSTANLARRLGAVLAGAVHTSTFAGRAKHAFETGMTGFDWSEAKVPQLFVHHIGDPCSATPYHDLKSAIGDLPLITVTGAKDTSGPACEALTEHGFRGREKDVMRAIAAWITTGQVTPQLGAP
jgi:hypothetical protein